MPPKTGQPQLVYRDSAGHVERSRTWGFDGTPIVTDQRYDDRGRPWEADQPRFENAPAYLARRQGYDDLNRLVSVTVKDDSGTDRTSTTTYRGLNVDQTNPLMQTRTETRDVLGQLRTVLDSGAPRGTTSFTYDPFGNLKTTTDPNGNVITVDYDNLGRKIGLHDPDLGWIEYSLDPLGQVYAQTSPVQRDAGQKTWMSYDELGRMTARYDSGDFQSHWIYDTGMAGVGQLAEAYTGQPTNKDYRRLHTYDSIGRPSLVTQFLKDAQYTGVPDYDTWGRVVSQTYRRGSDAPKVFNMRYNSYGYLARMDRGTQMLWKATQQDASGRVIVAALGNGLTQKRKHYDYSGRLHHAEVLTAANVARLQEGYMYDAIGNVTTRSQYWDLGGFQETFWYDTLNRLSSSQVAGQSELTYTYDGAGNMLTKTGVGTYTYPAQGANAYQPHAVQTVSSITGAYSYDKNGNLRSGGDRTVTWTAFDMPLTITKGSATATFYYGPEHQRVRQKRNDGDVIYAGAQEVEPIAGGGVRVKTYWPNGIGMEIDQSGTTQLNWIHADRLGSPIAMTAEDGTIRTDGKLEYDAWGKRRSAVDNVSTDDSIDGKIDNRGFTGHEMLDQLDLVHMNGRVYDPLIGKFMSGDPLISDPLNGQRYNRYSYVLNNPTNLTDPTGFSEAPITTEKVTGPLNPNTVCRGAGCAETLEQIDRQARSAARRACSGSADRLCSVTVGSMYKAAARAQIAADARSANNVTPEKNYGDHWAEYKREVPSSGGDGAATNASGYDDWALSKGYMTQDQWNARAAARGVGAAIGVGLVVGGVAVAEVGEAIAVRRLQGMTVEQLKSVIKSEAGGVEMLNANGVFGSGVPGARLALARALETTKEASLASIPEGLSARALQAYRLIATNAKNAGVEVQQIRVKIIDIYLRALGKNP